MHEHGEHSTANYSTADDGLSYSASTTYTKQPAHNEQPTTTGSSVQETLMKQTCTAGKDRRESSISVSSYGVDGNQYLQSLHKCYKWRDIQQNLEPGDVVLLKDKDLPRCQWKLGRIVKVLRRWWVGTEGEAQNWWRTNLPASHIQFDPANSQIGLGGKPEGLRWRCIRVQPHSHQTIQHKISRAFSICSKGLLHLLSLNLVNFWHFFF